MKINRFDFVDDDDICCFCNRKLPRKVAYFVEMDNGEEAPCGPVCIKKNLKNN
jgi:hypothetical protein